MQFICFAIVLAISVAMDPVKYKALTETKNITPELGISLVAVPGLWGLILSGFVTLGLLLFHMRKDNRLQRIGLSLDTPLPHFKDIAIGVALIVLTYLFNYVYSTYVVKEEELQTVTVQFINAIPGSAIYFAAKILAIGIFAGVLEEIIFRGFLQNSLKKYMSPIAAIIVAAVIFGAIHFQPLAFPGLALMGAVFGYIYHRTGSLYTNIALHAVNNAMAVVLL